MKTQHKVKNNYTFLKNIKFYYTTLLKWNPGLFAAFLLVIIPRVLSRLGAVQMTKTFAAGIENHWEPTVYLGSLAGLGIFLMLCTVSAKGLRLYVETQIYLYVQHYETLFAKKKMSVDYEVLESKQFKDQAALAEKHLWNHNALNEQVYIINAVLTALVGSITFALILGRKNPWLLLLLILSTAILFPFYYIARRYDEAQQPAVGQTWQEIWYITDKSRDISAGKDIRLYHMGSWFLHIFMNAFHRQDRIYQKVWHRYYALNIVETSLHTFRDILVYLYLITETCSGRMSAADLVFYTGIVSALSDWLWSMVRHMNDLGGFSFTLSCLRKFLDIPDRSENHATQKADIPENRQAEIVFEHVSYRYFGADKDTIHDLNLTIRAGESLALVGLNGAGKTTLVKLLCRLYHPTGGKILLNGTDIETFERESYFKLLSVLFQDISLLPVSLDENTAVCSPDKIDYQRLEYACKAAGIYEKIESLPQKGRTRIQREVWDDAVDLSGGERQKLLLARAIYPESSILILDEPTAALDPIAEHNIYMQYRDLSAGKTTLFISHRLASTRFCDRILLLENGQIVEEGTHDSLLEQNGRYARLFELQSEYYKSKSPGKEPSKQEIRKEGAAE